MRPERDLVSLGANGPSRDYATVGPGLLSLFPSHAREFGYSGDIVVGYVVTGDSVVFNVQMPTDCVNDKACADAYGMGSFSVLRTRPLVTDALTPRRLCRCGMEGDCTGGDRARSAAPIRLSSARTRRAGYPVGFERALGGAEVPVCSADGHDQRRRSSGPLRGSLQRMVAWPHPLHSSGASAAHRGGRAAFPPHDQRRTHPRLGRRLAGRRARLRRREGGLGHPAPVLPPSGAPRPSAAGAVISS